MSSPLSSPLKPSIQTHLRVIYFLIMATTYRTNHSYFDHSLKKIILIMYLLYSDTLISNTKMLVFL